MGRLMLLEGSVSVHITSKNDKELTHIVNDTAFSKI